MKRRVREEPAPLLVLLWPHGDDGVRRTTCRSPFYNGCSCTRLLVLLCCFFFLGMFAISHSGQRKREREREGEMSDYSSRIRRSDLREEYVKEMCVCECE